MWINAMKRIYMYPCVFIYIGFTVHIPETNIQTYGSLYTSWYWNTYMFLPKCSACKELTLWLLPSNLQLQIKLRQYYPPHALPSDNLNGQQMSRCQAKQSGLMVSGKYTANLPETTQNYTVHVTTKTSGFMVHGLEMSNRPVQYKDVFLLV